MNLLTTKLCLVFLVIIVAPWMKRPLFMAISGGLVTALMLYGIPVTDAVVIMGRFMASRDTITVVLSFYFIISLRRILECRGRLKQAEEPLNGLSNNRRINTSAAPAVIGLLLSVRVMNLCAEIVKFSCEDYISREDMTTVTSFFRHIPECFLPTCSFTPTALAVSGIGVGEFVVAMIPLVAVLSLIGYVFYPRKPPKATGCASKGGRVESVKMLVRSLWSILLIVVLIITADIPVYVAAPLVAVLNVFMDRLGMEEIRPIFCSVFESIIIFNTTLIMMSKGIVISIGVIHELPVFFGSLPIPMPLVFVLIFFFGSITSGASAIILLCISVTMVAMPQGRVSSLVLLMSSSYAAMQISPTHVYLFVIVEYFKANIGELVKRNIPMILLFLAAALGYTVALGVF